MISLCLYFITLLHVSLLFAIIFCSDDDIMFLNLLFMMIIFRLNLFNYNLILSLIISALFEFLNPKGV